MKKIFFILFLFCFFSCTTIDVEKRIMDSGSGGSETQGARQANFPYPIVIAEPEVVIVERPVFVPETERAPSRPATGEQAVRAANADGIVRPQDYSHAAMIYDYDPDFVYEIYAQPLRVCDISLQPGERAVEAPFISDSERWILGGGINYEEGVPVQHIYLKPISSGLEASLIINTDRRVYRIILRSYSAIHMPIIRWRYLPGMPNNFMPTGDSQAGAALPGIDPRFLSFNYRIRYGGRKPFWLPELVFDDGSKTYITFPNMILQRELPAVYENRDDIINYRVIGNLIVIDKLIENITIKIGRNEVSILKKRGG